MSISQILSSCCYLFTVSNSGLLSVQRPRPVSHAHYRHRQPSGLNSSIDSARQFMGFLYLLYYWNEWMLETRTLFKFLFFLSYNLTTSLFSCTTTSITADEDLGEVNKTHSSRVYPIRPDRIGFGSQSGLTMRTRLLILDGRRSCRSAYMTFARPACPRCDLTARTAWSLSGAGRQRT